MPTDQNKTYCTGRYSANTRNVRVPLDIWCFADERHQKKQKKHTNATPYPITTTTTGKDQAWAPNTRSKHNARTHRTDEHAHRREQHRREDILHIVAMVACLLGRRRFTESEAGEESAELKATQIECNLKCLMHRKNGKKYIPRAAAHKTN